jgi:hypothetical protein
MARDAGSAPGDAACFKLTCPEDFERLWASAIVSDFVDISTTSLHQRELIDVKQPPPRSRPRTSLHPSQLIRAACVI